MFQISLDANACSGGRQAALRLRARLCKAAVLSAGHEPNSTAGPWSKHQSSCAPVRNDEHGAPGRAHRLVQGCCHGRLALSICAAALGLTTSPTPRLVSQCSRRVLWAPSRLTSVTAAQQGQEQAAASMTRRWSYAPGLMSSPRAEVASSSTRTCAAADDEHPQGGLPAT